jgi:hypothetical protein
MKEPQRMIRHCLFLLIWHDFFGWARNNYDLGHVKTAVHSLIEEIISTLMNFVIIACCLNRSRLLSGHLCVKKRVADVTNLLRDVFKIHIFDASNLWRFCGRW